MNKFFLLLICCISMNVCAEAQFLTFSGGSGRVTGELPFLKKSMDYSEVNLGIEHPIGSKVFLDLNAGFGQLRYDYYDSSVNSIYARRNLLTTSASLNQSYKLSRLGARMYIGVGLTATFSIHDEKEVRTYYTKSTVKKGYTGSNLGGMLSTGLDFPAGAQSLIGLYMIAQKDFAYDYKDRFDKLKMTKAFVGISYKIKLKKMKA